MSLGLDLQTGNPKNYLTQPLYDSNAVATSATTELKFFTTPLGSGTTAFGSGVKSRVDTNLRQASQLPAGWSFTVYAIALAFWSTAATMAADIAAVMHNSFFTFLKGGSVEWLLIPTKFLCGGIGVDGFASTTATTTTLQGAHNGIASPDAIYKLQRPIPIAGQESFEAAINWQAAPSPTAAVPVTCMLHGDLLRAA